MRDAGDCYEYVAVYVDDLLCCLKDTQAFIDALTSEPFNYNLKGGEEPTYHLGGSFSRDEDGTLLWNAEKYVERLKDTYVSMFGERIDRVREPMQYNTHPELDDSRLCTPDEITQFQCLLGALQWTISLCRFDIAGAILALNTFSVSPRVGHVELIKRVARYVICNPRNGTRYRTKLIDHSHHEVTTHDWAQSVYGNVQEQVPHDAPAPKGRLVRTTTYKDANLMHNLVNGRSCTGIIHFLNQTPIDSFSKRQAQVETATFGSEFVAARQAVEQITDLRYTLRMMGVPIDGPAWLFGDNKGVVDNATIPHSRLAKRWNALSYHRVREAIAAGYVHFLHLSGNLNPSDILTKQLKYIDLIDFVEVMMCWEGDTINFLKKKEKKAVRFKDELPPTSMCD